MFKVLYQFKHLTHLSCLYFSGTACCGWDSAPWYDLWRSFKQSTKWPTSYPVFFTRLWGYKQENRL